MSYGDKTTNPDYYTSGKVECIDAIESALGKTGLCDFCTGNIIKYLWRWRSKGGELDLKKARWYLNHLIEIVEDMKLED